MKAAKNSLSGGVAVYRCGKVADRRAAEPYLSCRGIGLRWSRPLGLQSAADPALALAAEVPMTIPFRGTSKAGTYFIAASTWEKKAILQSDRMATLLVNVLLHYKHEGKYLLHEFVVMPNHFHVLITPTPPTTLERAIQFIKGGFSYRGKKELGYFGEIWQTSFYDHRVRDPTEYARFREYIHMNPVRRGLAIEPEEFPYSSAKMSLDEVPQWLKPVA